MSVNNFENLEGQPVKLLEEEIKDPYLVLFRFFDYADLPSVREHLWDWLKVTVSGTFSSYLLNKGQRYDLVYLYEHIEKLVEAAYLIHLQQPGSQKKRKKKHKQ